MTFIECSGSRYFASEILNIFNKRPNIKINIEYQHLGKCRVRYFDLFILMLTDSLWGSDAARCI